MGIGELTLNIALNLIASLIYDSIDNAELDFFGKRRIKQKIENSVADVVEPLMPFLQNEGISEDKQYRLIETCANELKFLIEKPNIIFQGSLDGQKIFEDLYSNGNYPQVIVEDNLQHVYSLLYPRIATLICKIPAAVKGWEIEAWAENYRRLDEVSDQLKSIFSKIDSIHPDQGFHEGLNLVRKTLAQKVLFKLELTGLRSNSPMDGNFDDYFIHPEIQEYSAELNANSSNLKNKDDGFKFFSRPKCRAIILGQAGMGKSTLTKWLQREAVTNHWNGISIRVELRKLIESQMPSVYDLVRDSAGKHMAETLTTERIDYWLQKERIIFILDGFDEIPPSDRDHILEWIQEMSTAIRSCPLILSSRPLTTAHLSDLSLLGWQIWNIQPFDLSRVVDYIQRWYSHSPLSQDAYQEISAQELAQSWKREPTIAPLTGNPLLLSTLLMVHHLDGELPSGRSKLYERYIDGMLGIWDQRRKIPSSDIAISSDSKRLILRRLALYLFLQEKEEIEETEINAWLEKLLTLLNINCPIDQILASLRERTGLVVGPGTYSFVHKTVAEYLVSESIIQGDQKDDSDRRIDRFYLLRKRSEDRWNIVIFLWAGLASVTDLEDFISECINQNEVALGLGILSDQWHRFSLETKRMLVLNASQRVEGSDLRKSNTSWACSYNKLYFFNSKNNSEGGFYVESNIHHESEFRIPTFPLRSLSGLRSFHDLIKQSIFEKVIYWPDQEALPGELRHLFWMHFLTQTQELDDLIFYFQIYSEIKEATEKWIYWAVESVCGRILNEALDIEISSFLIQLKDSCQLAYGLFPVALIGSVFVKISWEKNIIDEFEGEVLDENPLPVDLNLSLQNRVVSALSSERVAKADEIPREWLLGTSDHVFDLFGGDVSGDILNRMISLLVEWLDRNKEEIGENEKLYQKSIGYIDALIKQRSTLETF